MPRRAEILIIGLEHVLPKVANWVLSLEQQGIHSVIYSQDIFGLSRKVLSQYSIPVYFVPEFLGKLSRWLLGYPLFLFLLFWYHPKHLEVYDPELCNGYWIACIHTALRLGLPVVILNRGGLYSFSSLSPVKHDKMRHIYKESKLIIVKELYMETILQTYDLVTRDKIALVSNRVKIDSSPDISSSIPPIVLYLNNYRRWKRPDLCIHAAAIVLKQVKNVEFWFVGDLDTKGLKQLDVWNCYSAEELLQLAQDLNVEAHIKTFPFTSNPRDFYNKASIFLLPADEVFCNFSLLEAMERGIPPIISDVPGSERIVDHGINGYRVKQEADEIAKYIIALLENEETRQGIGRAARAKVEHDFDINKLGTILADLYRNRVWEI